MGKFTSLSFKRYKLRNLRVPSVASVAVAITTVAFLVGAPATIAADQTASQSASTGPTIQVVLPVSPGANLISPTLSITPDVPIDCTVDLGEYVHFSVKGNDISWHWDWTCDGFVSLAGGQAIKRDGVIKNSSGVSGTGAAFEEIGENIRYGTCENGTWQGTAYGTFTSPDHGPASFQGASPTGQDITGC